MLPDIPWINGDIAWRVLNAIMAFHALILLLILMKKHWKKSPASVRLLMQGLAAFLLATLVASVESILQSNPLGIRTTLFTVATFWAVVGLQNYDKASSPKKKTENGG